MTNDEIKLQDAQSVMQTYARYDAVIDHGKGATLYGADGKEYIDFTSGIGVNSIGYGDEKWAGAIYAQAMKLQHVSNLFYTEPYVRLSKELTERTGMKNVFFCNSGAEANEGMIKLARKYSFDKYGAGRSDIITLSKSFHGRTVTTLAATGQESFHKFFFPFTGGFAYAPPNDIKALEAMLGGATTCAIIMEPVQGEGGVLPLDPGYVKAAAELCAARDILLMLDEVQTGIGRTGTLFAYEQHGVKPDVVSFAKGIAGGLPMGGFLACEKCASVFTPGTHGTTFGGNPIAAAAALEVLGRLDDELLADVKKKGKYIMDAVGGWQLPVVGEIRGSGLMIGISLESAVPKEVAAACVRKGLLMLTAGTDAIRMLPPLTITMSEIDKGLSILKETLVEILLF